MLPSSPIQSRASLHARASCKRLSHAHTHINQNLFATDTLQKLEATDTCKDQTSEHEAMALIKRLYMPAHRQLARMNI